MLCVCRKCAAAMYIPGRRISLYLTINIKILVSKCANNHNLISNAKWCICKWNKKTNGVCVLSVFDRKRSCHSTVIECNTFRIQRANRSNRVAHCLQSNAMIMELYDTVVVDTPCGYRAARAVAMEGSTPVKQVTQGVYIP